MKAVPVTIRFKTTLYVLKKRTILLLPKVESSKLSSRGQISITGTLNGHEFSTVLEPDGRWSHWMRITEDIQKSADVKPGDTVTVEMTPSAIWPEPATPKDLEDALADASVNVKDKWKDITPMARWEWVRWVNATASPQTRLVRIEKTLSKLEGKHRRPCCFNLSACTDPELAKNGQLIEVE